MKTYILIGTLILTVLCFTTSAVSAKTVTTSKQNVTQEHNKKDGRGDKKNHFDKRDRKDGLLRFISEELELTSEQKEEIMEILKEKKSEFKKEEMSKRKENREEIMGMIKSDVLTKEQSAKLDELNAKRESGELFEEKRNERMDRLAEDLKLSDEQITKLDELLRKRRNDKGAMRDKEENARKINREKRNESREELSKILTTEQLEKFEQMHKNRMENGKERKLPSKR